MLANTTTATTTTATTTTATAATAAATNDDLLRLEHICKEFSVSGGKLMRHIQLKAVNDVSFSVKRGETFGLVGESGCGKSTLSKIALRLMGATSGAAYFEGRDIYKMSYQELKAIRKDMQVVFQDPYDSLNPRLTLKEIVAEPLKIHNYAKGNRAERDQRIEQLFIAVGLPPQLMVRYPHQLSGGQRQRLCIARALALSPKFIVCDEAVSALDVSIQAQILNLLMDLKEQFGLTYLFISHNLSVIKFVSDRIGVMYLGRMMEVAEADELFENVLHPYTHALLSAVPDPDPAREKQRVLLAGSVPSLFNQPSGCIFHTRCPYAAEICQKEVPPLQEKGQGHQVACHLADSLDLRLSL